jgi:hypothetical protein
MLRYARTFDRITETRAAEVLTRIDEAIADGTYLAIVPQFVVTAGKP